MLVKDVVDVKLKNIGPGWKVAFDNLDLFQKVRHMREDNQNKYHHWINHIKVTNRVSGNHLTDDKPIYDSLMELDNIKASLIIQNTFVNEEIMYH